MSNSMGQIERKSHILAIVTSAIMAALVTVATYIIQIPVPQTGGYINVGDAMIFAAALIFGPVVGGFAGGVGSAITDIALGYANFALVTLIVKGTEGVLAGFVSDGMSWLRDVIAVGVGGAAMVLGYFLVEFFVMGYGAAAFVEVPGNIFQITFGGLVGIPISNVVRKYLPAISHIRQVSSPF